MKNSSKVSFKETHRQVFNLNDLEGGEEEGYCNLAEVSVVLPHEPVLWDDYYKPSEESIFFLKHQKITHPEYYICRVNDAEVHHEGLVCGEADLGCVIYKDITSPVEVNKKIISDSFVSIVDRPCFLLFFGNASGINNSHWVVQTMTRLYAASLLVEKHYLIVTGTVKRYQLNLLKRLGYSDEDIIIRDTKTSYNIQTLYAVNFYNDFPNIPSFFDRIQNLPEIENAEADIPSPDKIYISRVDTYENGVRRFINEFEVQEMLVKMGFTVVVPSQIPAGFEPEYFSKAKLVVGALGAGLCNLIYAKRGVRVLALTDQSYAIKWYSEMAMILGWRLGYQFGYGIPAVRKITRHVETHNSWFIDLKRLEKNINKMIDIE
jgi:hypothetical protein